MRRCILPGDFGTPTESHIHHFSEVHGAVSHLAKSRLAPIKPLTIPRLELCAAVLAVHMDCLLRRELRIPIDGSTFWTNSTIVLQYIRSENKRFQTLVANCVGIIHDGSSPDQWRHVEGKLNPADDASRGLDAAHMISCTRWLQGPEFLWGEPKLWPVECQTNTGILEHDMEVKCSTRSCATVFQ